MHVRCDGISSLVDHQQIQEGVLAYHHPGVAGFASLGLAVAGLGGSAWPAACEAIGAGITASPCLAVAGPGGFAGIPSPMGSTAAGAGAPAAGWGAGGWACPFGRLDPLVPIDGHAHFHYAVDYVP